MMVTKDGEGWKYRGEEVDFDDFWRVAAREHFDQAVELLNSTMAELGATKDFLDGGIPWKSLSDDEKHRWTTCFEEVFGLPCMVDEFNQFSEAERSFYKSDVARWFLARCLEYLRLRLESGDGLAIFDAVLLCGRYSIAMPQWAVEGFSERWMRLSNWEAKTLDDAFGQVHRKNLNADSEARIRAFGGAAAKIVQQRKAESNQPIDELMFEDISKEIGGDIPPSTLRKWYQKYLANSRKWNGRDPI